MSRARGFTLVELLVGIAVSSVILMAVAASFIGISGAYSNESQSRSAVEGGRTALAFFERHVKLAGYGIDPRFAFDFTDPTGLANAKDNYAVDTTYRTDDLAFRYRDPAFMRRGTSAATAGNFATTTALRRALPVGTAFMIACPGGGQRAWFRSSTATTPADTSVALTPYGTVHNAAPATALECLGRTGDQAPFLFVLREFRFRVFKDAVSGRAFLGFVPSLATDLSSVPASVELLSDDVEELQVAYQMNRPQPGTAFATTAAPDSGGNWIMVDSAGETALPNMAAAPPSYDDAYESANRYNAHPANIRAVRVSFSVRSARQRQDKALGYIRGDMENGSGGPTSGDGYFRSWMTSSIRTPNMASRFFFLPPLESTGTTHGNKDGA